MIPRLTLCVSLCCGLAVASESGPWSRFFDKPAISADQGAQHAMSTAVSSAFNPLRLSVDKSEPPFPPLDKPLLDTTIARAAQPGLCSVPLTKTEPPKDKYFFMHSVKPRNSNQDAGLTWITKAPPCK